MSEGDVLDKKKKLDCFNYKFLKMKNKIQLKELFL